MQSWPSTPSGRSLPGRPFLRSRPLSRRVPTGTGTVGSDPAPGYARRVAETTQSLDQRLEEIGAQLAWVRDYL